MYRRGRIWVVSLIKFFPVDFRKTLFQSMLEQCWKNFPISKIIAMTVIVM